jgi:creatinine amidohydrolase
MKYRLWDMSWREAEEAFKKSDTVILPTGTLHAHGPSPISIDSSSPEKLADEVGKRTGLIVLPLVPYGEDEKMKLYPGTISISPNVLQGYYLDICRSLHRNGIRKVLVLNGHGGNREILMSVGRNIREHGMLMAIVDWYNVGTKTMPDLFPRPHVFIEELAVAIAIGGKDVVDIGKVGYRGEWGWKEFRKIFGDKIEPRGFDNFEYKGGPVIIPVDAWDVDLDTPPEIREDELDKLEKQGQEILKRCTDYIVDFAKDFEKIDVERSLGSKHY